MTISIPDLTVSFASHLPADVTSVEVTYDGVDDFVTFRTAKGNLSDRHCISKTEIELSKVNVAVEAARRVNREFADYEQRHAQSRR